MTIAASEPAAPPDPCWICGAAAEPGPEEARPVCAICGALCRADLALLVLRDQPTDTAERGALAAEAITSLVRVGDVVAAAAVALEMLVGEAPTDIPGAVQLVGRALGQRAARIAP